MEVSIQVNCHVNCQPILSPKSNWKTWKSSFLLWEPHYQLNESFQVLKQCPQDKMYANQRPLVAIRAFPRTGADESTFRVRVWSLTWQTKTRLRWGWGGDEPVKLTGYRSRIRNHLGCCEWLFFFQHAVSAVSLIWDCKWNSEQKSNPLEWNENNAGSQSAHYLRNGRGAVFLEWSHS